MFSKDRPFLSFKFIPCLFALAFLTGNHNEANASIIDDLTIQIGQSAGEGVSYSFLHSADLQQSHNPWRRRLLPSMTGNSVQIGLAGNELTGELNTDTNVLTITGTVPSAFQHDSLTLNNGNLVQSNSLTFTGGKLIIDQFGGGFLDYELNIAGTITTGSFYFARRNAATFDEIPNSGSFDGSELELYAWGNNWTYLDSDVDWSFIEDLGRDLDYFYGRLGDFYNAFGNRLGIDLYASSTVLPVNPVPEPSTLLISSLLLMGLCCNRRIRR